MARTTNKRGSVQKSNRRRPKFATTRIKRSQSPEDASSAESGLEQDLPNDQIEDEPESDTENAARSYNTLLVAFNINPEREEHRRKRRRLGKTKSRPDQDPEDSEEEEDDEEDVSDDENDEQKKQRETGIPEVEDSSDDESIRRDPYNSHFESPDQQDLDARMKALSAEGWHSIKREMPGLGRGLSYEPKGFAGDVAVAKKPADLLSSAVIKKRLVGAAKKVVESFADIDRAIAPHLLGYSDILFGGRTPRNAAGLRRLSCLHVLNHVFKTRDKVLKHNARLSKDPDGAVPEYRDQGFTRPKALFLLPTRNACAKVMQAIVDICEPEQQENRKRFEDNFLRTDGDIPEDRPEDYKDLFGGNDDDMFRVGVKFTRKTIKFFTQFYNSDIILASPLGLRNAIETGEGKKQDFDYLSSIEIVVIDQADALLMQNWEHVTFVMSHLNLSPTESHGCDFSRVRMWYLDDNAKYLRQTIVLSSYLTPEINSLFTTYMTNISGKIKYQPSYDGTTLTTGLPIKQTFSKFHCPTVQSDPDARFKFFTATITPWILRCPRPPDGALGILIFIPSYFDFVRVRNYFSTSPTVSSIAFGSITEHKSPRDAETRRARAHFVSGKHSVLLYTGRAHHFYRYMIKGVKSVVLYQLPDNPIFYSEIVSGFLGTSVTAGRIAGEEGRVRALFSKWDALRLERIVGTNRVRSMLGAGDTFDFV